MIGRPRPDLWTRLVGRTIGVLSPGRALSWTKKRMALLSYYGGAKSGPNRNWRPSRGSADEIIRRDWVEVVARARDLVRNSPHVSGALDRVVSNVCHTGIHPQARLVDQRGNLLAEQNAEVEKHFRAWAKAVGWQDIVELVFRHDWTDGESLLHFYPDRDLLARGIVPLGVEVIEADLLDDSLHGALRNGHTARRGIEFDQQGRVVAYHLRTAHPGDPQGTSLEVRRVDASEIVHVFERRRASQTRGISRLAAMIQLMRNYDEYQDSEQIAARLLSAFGFFIESPYPEAGAGAICGFGPEGYGPGAGADGDAATGNVPDFVEPGRICTLPSGTKIQTAGTNRPSQAYEPFSKQQLRTASVAAGMSYEAFSNDYTDASYSSARSAALEERRNYARQQNYLVRKACEPMWTRFTAYLSAFGIARGIPAEVPVSWQTPGWPWVDPLKDAKAAELELGLGLTTRRKLCAQRGEDFDENVSQLEREERRMREANIPPKDKETA